MIKDLQIYCDGSRDDYGYLGIGLVYVSDDKILKQSSYGLPFKGESYIAEFTAVICALSTLDIFVENLTIYTDQITLVNRTNTAAQESVSKFYELLEDTIDNVNCRKIRFRYVKSHANNKYHNLADKLADLGRKQNEICSGTMA